MTADATPEQLRLGFLTAIEIPQVGYIGGLLVTNQYGRPLEFQCTTPVGPNRIQQILYGPTLVPFILGELIGRTLIERVGVKPDLVLTENRDLLCLREHVNLAVAVVEDAGLQSTDESDSATGNINRSADSPTLEIDNAAVEENRTRLSRQTLRFHDAHQTDQDALANKLHLIPRGADLMEPFERVREALRETTNAGTRR